MGVSIYTQDGTKHTEMPYSSLQEFRIMVLRAYIEYIKDRLRREYNGELILNDDDNDLLDELDGNPIEYQKLQDKLNLQSLLAKLNADNMIKTKRRRHRDDDDKEEINYDDFIKLNVRDYDAFLYKNPGGIGLYKFIYHADDTGFHSRGESYDINQMLVQIHPYFAILPDIYQQYAGPRQQWFDTYKRYLDEFIDVFNESIETGKIVQYS